MEDELVAFSEKGRLNLKILLAKPPNYWPFIKGNITRDFVINELPIEEQHRSAFLICGTKDYSTGVFNSLKAAGVQEENILVL